MDENAASLARKWGLGLELTDFCEARKLEEPAAMEAARARCSGIGSLWLHAPFAELSPCAIDPRVREVIMLRFRQTVQAALALGIRRIVVHSGYIPLVYFPEWFTARSVEFWREFLRDAPGGLCLALENVMEPGPDMLVQIAAGVDDPRFGLCLDVGHANTRVSETPPLLWLVISLRPLSSSQFISDWDSSTFKFNSSSCFGSSAEGASSITSRPLLFFGKAIQSLILSRPANMLTQRSRPYANPP